MRLRCLLWGEPGCAQRGFGFRGLRVNLAGCSGVEFWFSRTVGEPGRVVRWCFFDVKARPGGSATKEKFRSEPGGLNQLMGGTTLVAFRGGFGVGEEGLGAFAGAIHTCWSWAMVWSWGAMLGRSGRGGL